MSLDDETMRSLVMILRDIARKSDSPLSDIQDLIFPQPDSDWCSEAMANLDGRNEVVRLSMLLVADLLSEDRMAKTRAERTMMALDSAIRWVSKFGRPVREL
jgi:hypothetical protein